jgi:hypothetical protein
MAIAFLMVIFVVPVLPFWDENETIDGYLQPLLCQPGETIERDLYSGVGSRGGTSYSMNVYCIDEKRDRRDETSWATAPNPIPTKLH